MSEDTAEPNRVSIAPPRERTHKREALEQPKKSRCLWCFALGRLIAITCETTESNGVLGSWGPVGASRGRPGGLSVASWGALEAGRRLHQMYCRTSFLLGRASVSKTCKNIWVLKDACRPDTDRPDERERKGRDRGEHFPGPGALGGASPAR